MNKTELKNFAVSARRDLLEKVTLRAQIFGIDEKNDLKIEEKFGQVFVNGTGYPLQMKSAFNSLVSQLKTKGYEQLLEEVSYTWFNRIIAIRYMEVHDYLPSRVNVLSSKTGKAEPDILTLFETVDLDVDVPVIKDIIHQGKTEEAYRILFIAQNNALNKILPFLFEKINDFTELLLPDFLLDNESVISKLTKSVALTESFQEVEVIGWLYQFYNSEPKDKVFTNLKKSRKIEKYDIPAATQLFTPKWIVQYMVENSLGHLWVEANPETNLKADMRYYLEPAYQEKEVKQQLENIYSKNINLEEISFIDPCVGSGHILVYAFDLLYRMYEEAGYPSNEIPQIILEKNLYGLDIDDRAAQLASFVLIMKAREKSRRIFGKNLHLNVYAIQDSNHLDKDGFISLLAEDKEESKEVELILNTFKDAKYFGSMLQPIRLDIDKYLKRISKIGDTQLTTETFIAFEQLNEFKKLITIYKLLMSKYDVIVTNPPYMGAKGMNKTLLQFVQNNYQQSKSDLFAVFLERSMSFAKENRYISTINQHSWMFLSRYELLRKKVLNRTSIESMLHLGPRAFDDIGGEVVQSTSFVLRNYPSANYNGKYYRLVDYRSTEEKRDAFINSPSLIIANQSSFSSIPGSPVSYWCSERVKNVFKEFRTINDYAEPRQGLSTSDNERFLRRWYEVSYTNIGFNFLNRSEANLSGKKWFPYNKGGSYKKWYGNNEYVINWYKDGEELREWAEYLNRTRTSMGRLVNKDYYFKEGITWSSVTTSSLSMRYSKGAIFDAKGPMLFPKDSTHLFELLAFVNSKLASELILLLSPTLDYSQGPIGLLPFETNEIYKEQIKELVSTSIKITKDNWDFYETSWDFNKHPLILFKNELNVLNNIFKNWNSFTTSQFDKLMAKEEELNHIFINFYHMNEELSPEIPEKDITIQKANKIQDTKSFLSYVIGCIMGRYSIDLDGMVFAGGGWDHSKYQTFKPNKYGLVLLTDEHYFEDDIIARLREFLSVTFGSETVDENLQWLAESLELKPNESAEERLRRYFLDDFFKDHCQIYQKRPIYWLLDSGKQKGLRTLIYIHRYQPDTMATIRFEHLQEIQAKYHYEISAVDARIVNSNLSATEKRELEKRKTDFQKRLDELLEFDKKLAEYANGQIIIDLDDGVNVNYQKFEKVLAKIK